MATKEVAKFPHRGREWQYEATGFGREWLLRLASGRLFLACNTIFFVFLILSRRRIKSSFNFMTIGLYGINVSMELQVGLQLIFFLVATKDFYSFK
jgi:hypothetical protein